MASLPNHVATYLAKYPDAEAAYDLVAAMVPPLSVAQRSAFDSDQAAAARIKEAEVTLARYRSTVAHRERGADAAEEARLGRVIESAKSARLTTETVLHRLTRVSAGSRTALDRLAGRLHELARDNAKLEAAKPPPPSKGKPVDIVATQRAALDALDDEAEQIERALPPRVEALASAKASLGAEIKRGRIGVDSRGRLVVPEIALAVLPMAGGIEPVRVVDAFAVLVALNPDAAEKAVEAAVERRYAGAPEQLSSIERRKRLVEIQARRFEIELVEVAAVFKSWRAGDLSVGLRPDTDTDAVLGFVVGR